MANSNLKLGVVTARYLASDGVSDASHTLATSSSLPIGAAVTRVSLISRGVFAASGSATFIHCTTDDEIIFTNGTNTITAGKLTVFVEYYASGDLS